MAVSQAKETILLDNSDSDFRKICFYYFGKTTSKFGTILLLSLGVVRQGAESSVNHQQLRKPTTNAAFDLRRKYPCEDGFP